MASLWPFPSNNSTPAMTTVNTINNVTSNLANDLLLSKQKPMLSTNHASLDTANSLYNSNLLFYSLLHNQRQNYQREQEKLQIYQFQADQAKMMNELENKNSIATRTPGRKSASPKFFSSSFETHASAFVPSSQSRYGLYATTQHSFDSPSIQSTHKHNQQLNQTLTSSSSMSASSSTSSFLSLSSTPFSFSSSANSQNRASDAASSFHCYGIATTNDPLSMPHAMNLSAANSLRIPTTPTRSKSLSPSLYQFLPPARIRHKQMVYDKLENSPSSPSRQLQVDNIHAEPLNLSATSTIHSLKNPIVDEHSSNPNQKKCQNNDAKSSDDLIMFKLPFNVRTLNLNNFPANRSPHSKRPYSIQMQRMRSRTVLTTTNKEASLSMLKKSLQSFFNAKLNETIDLFKKEFIDPILENVKLNTNKENIISNEDVTRLLLSLLDEANRAERSLRIDDGLTENVHSLDSLNANGKRQLDYVNDDVKKDSSEASTPLSLDSSFKKHKTSDEDDDDLADNETLSMSIKNDDLNYTEFDLDYSHIHCETTSPGLDITFKTIEIDTSTRCVLGKHVNDLYAKLSTQYREPSVTSTTGLDQRNVYAKFPNLFKYKTDTSDRQWLTEQAILKRKNVKSYILLYDEVVDLFRLLRSRPLKSKAINESKNNRPLDELLKTFQIGDTSLLDKLKRLYSYRINIA